MTKHLIEVYTMQDCNDLCGILSRNGYMVTALNIVQGVSNTATPKQWKIEYYNPQEFTEKDMGSYTLKLTDKAKELARSKINE